MTDILYVDDDSDIREIVEMALGLDPDINVRVCGSGIEAEALVANWVPNLILLDFMMPGLDGPATLALLRQNPALTEVPVVFLTARTAERDVAALMATGAAGVIAKPFNPLTLADACKRFLK